MSKSDSTQAIGKKNAIEYYTKILRPETGNLGTHLGLAKDSPRGRAIETDGALVSHPILGGLHHRYVRIPSQ